MRKLLSFGAGVVLAAGSFVVGRSASGAVVGPDCGGTIIANTTLTQDIGPCASGGLTIAADGVTLNLNGFTIYGTTSTGDGNGVTINGQTNDVVKNGTIAGFDEGIRIMGATSTIVTGMRLRGNIGDGSTTGDGLYSTGSTGTLVSHSALQQNGPFSGATFRGGTNESFVDSKALSNTGWGVSFIVGSGGSVVGSVVSANGDTGITSSSTGARIASNTVTANGYATQNPGIFVSGSNSVVSHNVIHGNGSQGIRVFNGAAGVHVARNDARRNAAVVPAFDLQDDNPACGTDVWRRNLGTRNASCIH